MSIVAQANVAAINAHIVDASGYFHQSDAEFDADLLPVHSVTALTERLAAGPVDHETADFLKGYMIDAKSHFNAFFD